MNYGEENKDLVKQVIGRKEALKLRRQPWESSWKDAAKYIHPRREFLLEKNEGAVTGTDRYSSHAIKCNQTHSSGMQGNLISAAIRWFRLSLRNREANLFPFVKDWMERAENEVYASYQESGFYSAIGKYLLDAGAICTAILYIGYDFKKDQVLYKTISPGECYIAEGADEMVNTLVREFTRTTSQLQEQFGDNLPESILNEIANGDLDEDHTVTHFVGPRRNRDNELVDNKNMPFASYYILDEDEHLLREGGFEEFPYMVLRLRKNPDEEYGRGPGLDCLEAVKKLNQFEKAQLQLAQLLVEPPLDIPEERKGRVKYVPRAKNYRQKGDETVGVMAVNGNYAVGKDAIAELKAEIDSFFHVDFFMMLQRATRQMTAREVIERQGEKAAVIGSEIGNLYQEGIRPGIKRTFGVLFRAGRIPEPPADLMNSGAKIEIEMTGPLSMAQKYYAKSQGINKGIEAIGPIVQYDQTVLDNFNFDVLSVEAAESGGFPQTAIREKHEVQQIRQKRAQQIAAEKQMESAERMSKMVPSLNHKVEPESPLEAVNEQLAASLGTSQGGPAQ